MADLENENGMLELLALPAELQQPGANRRVVDPGQVATDLVFRQAGATGERLEARANERLEVTAVLRIGELDLLAHVQDRKRARFELASLHTRVGLRGTVLVLVRRDDWIIRADLLDEPGDHRRDLLANDLSVRILLQLVQLSQHGR